MMLLQPHSPTSLLLFAICIIASPIVSGTITNNGRTISISYEPSTLPTVQCGEVPGPLFQGISPPYPTDTWWVGAGVSSNGQTSKLAGPFPYLSAALPLGVTFGLPQKRYFDGTSIHSPFQDDLQVGLAEVGDDIKHHKALGWDELSVTIQWFNGSSTMTSYLVQGSAYMTFKYVSATVNVRTSSSKITSVNNVAVNTSPVTIKGTKFKFTLASGTTWILYSLSSISLTFSSTLATTSGQWTGVVRIVALNGTDGNTENVLDSSSSTYATGADISYDVQHANGADVATVSYLWKVESGDKSKLLQLAWIHHRDILKNAVYAPSVKFLTVKGYQSGVLGSVWQLVYTLPSISWFARRSPDKSCINILNKALEDEVASMTTVVPNEFYFWGGSFSRVARFALIAEELGRTDLIPKIVSVLKASFQPWLSGNNSDPAAYETRWGGVVSKSGATNVNVDYGNGYYNDHHFHYGYHLYGASVIAKYDTTWFNTNKRYITGLARDIGNPSSSDPYYTVSRHKDWFAGHSWASGIGYGAGARDEESSTEAINGYYGLYMYALVSENCDLQDFARILLASEIQSVQHYWHMYPSATTETAYPESGLRKWATIGNVQQEQAGAWLFWGGQKSEIAAIQILPVTPITELVADVAWAKAMYDFTSVEFADSAVSDSWKSVIYMTHAAWDPKAAFAESQLLTDWGSGNSNLNTIWFMSTRALSNTGNICSAAVHRGVNIYTGLLFSKSANSYIAVNAQNSYIYATSALSAATVFNFDEISGGTTVQSKATGLYMDADNTGKSPVIVNRNTASAWETYTFTQITINGKLFYSILAHSNNLYLAVQSNGQIVNNVKVPIGQQPPDVALFAAVCPGGAATCPGPVAKNYTYVAGHTITQPPVSSNCLKTGAVYIDAAPTAAIEKPKKIITLN